VIPLVIQILAARDIVQHPSLALLMVIAGGFALRWALVSAGQARQVGHDHLVGDGPLSGLDRQALRLVEVDDQLGNDVQVVRAPRQIPVDTLCRKGFDRIAVGVALMRAAKGPRRRPSTARRHA